MPTPLTRQDIMAITDGAKNTIIQKLVTKRDIQGASDNARDRILNTINTFHIENQNLLRQNTNQNDQTWRRILNMESQINSLRQEVRILITAVNRLYEVEAQHINRMRNTRATEQTNPY